jgi:hypothetical protein
VSLSVTDRLCRSGGLVTVKSTKLELDPSEFVTVIGPVVEPAGTIAVIWTSESTVKPAGAPLNATADAKANPVPTRVTLVPIGPLRGANAPITGAGGLVTVKSTKLELDPSESVTVIGPVVEPAGTIAVI